MVIFAGTAAIRFHGAVRRDAGRTIAYEKNRGIHTAVRDESFNVELELTTADNSPFFHERARIIAGNRGLSKAENAGPRERAFTSTRVRIEFSVSLGGKEKNKRIPE